MSDLSSILGFIDEGLLDFTKEAQQSINRASFIQGDPTKANDPALKDTWHYWGGVKISNEGLSEEQMKLAEGTSSQKTDATKTYSVFKRIDVVVLAYSYNRRFYRTIHEDGQDKKILWCGSNETGKNAMGWNGQHCQSCEFTKQNMQAAGYDTYNEEHCQSKVDILAYIPLLDHTCILEFGASKYSGASDLINLVAKLSREFAKRPDVQAKSPGLQRVNSYLFKVGIGLGAHKEGKSKSTYQDVEIDKLAAPYPWDKILLTGEQISKAKQSLTDLQEDWNRIFHEPAPNAYVIKNNLQIESSQPVAQIGTTVGKMTIEAETVTAEVVNTPAPTPAPETHQVLSTPQQPAFVEAPPTATEMAIDEDDACPF